MAGYVITEADLFKTTLGDNISHTKEDAISNSKWLMGRVKINIFRDEYAIMYKVLEWCNEYHFALSRDLLQQLMLNEERSLLKSKKITIDAENKNDTERFQNILNQTLSTYDLLTMEDYDSQDLEGNTQIYLETWAEQELSNAVYDMNTIITSELKVKNRTYFGWKDADAYYTYKSRLIKDVVDNKKDLLDEAIDTSLTNGLDIQERIIASETNADLLGYTGIESFDEMTGGFHRKELGVIQAGSGVGKTRSAAGMIAYPILKNGYNVLHLSLEQTPTRVFPLYLSRHILENQGTLKNMSDRDIMKSTYDPRYEGVVQEGYNSLTTGEGMGKLLIEGRSLKTTELMDYLDDTYSRFPFDLVIIDYYTQLTPSKAELKYNELSDVANQLKSDCKKGKGYFCLVLNQLTSDEEGKLLKGDFRTVKLGGAGSQDLIRGADFQFTLFQSPELKLERKMKMLIGKVRGGESSVSEIGLDVDLGRCAFIESPDEEENNFV